MTWTLLHDRMAFMAELIRAAETDAHAALGLAGRASELTRLFGDEEGLVLALRQRWLTALTARLDQAAYEGVPPEQARAQLMAEQPGLRALLDIADRRSLRMRSLSGGEHRVMELFGGSIDDRRTVA